MYRRRSRDGAAYHISTVLEFDLLLNSEDCGVRARLYSKYSVARVFWNMVVYWFISRKKASSGIGCKKFMQVH